MDDNVTKYMGKLLPSILFNIDLIRSHFSFHAVIVKSSIITLLVIIIVTSIKRPGFVYVVLLDGKLLHLLRNTFLTGYF